MAENVTQIKSAITINVGVSVKIWKNIMCAKKIYFWNLATCSCENGKYVGSIIDDSVIMCDEIIKEAKNVPTKIVTTNNISVNLYILIPFY